METKNAPFIYLGSQFFSKNPTPRMAAAQAMTQPERIALFVDKEATRNRLFIELAKLFLAEERAKGAA